MLCDLDSARVRTTKFEKDHGFEESHRATVRRPMSHMPLKMLRPPCSATSCSMVLRRSLPVSDREIPSWCICRRRRAKRMRSTELFRSVCASLLLVQAQVRQMCCLFFIAHLANLPTGFDVSHTLQCHVSRLSSVPRSSTGAGRFNDMLAPAGLDTRRPAAHAHKSKIKMI